MISGSNPNSVRSHNIHIDSNLNILNISFINSIVLVHRVSLPLAHLRFIAGRNHRRTACLAASCDLRPSGRSRSRRG